jgi:hypothetical protein
MKSELFLVVRAVAMTYLGRSDGEELLLCRSFICPRRKALGRSLLRRRENYRIHSSEMEQQQPRPRHAWAVTRAQVQEPAHERKGEKKVQEKASSRRQQQNLQLSKE